MKKTGYFLSGFGPIKYVYDNEIIYQLSFIFDEEFNGEFDPKINQLLSDYFEGKTRQFPLSFSYENKTVFQKKVLDELLKIPYGETRSYQEIAVKIGHPKAVRAVGQACKSNPIGIMIPCHRVIGKNKQLTGYSGKNYIFLKEKLLKLEQNFKSPKQAI